MQIARDTDTAGPQAVIHFGHWRHVGVALLIGLALTIAACGSTIGGGGQPRPTPKPTATVTPSLTPTPAPCIDWRVIPSPNVSGYPQSELHAVSALSPTQAWAVGGGATQSLSWQSLVEQWDGNTWHLVASAGSAPLNGVAALSERDVWAVGGVFAYGAARSARPLILHWDGITWSVVPGAQPANTNSVELASVAALASNNVWAVGSQVAASGTYVLPLVEHWDGLAWHVVSIPLPQGATPGWLSTVTRVPGTNQLWAVGFWGKYADRYPVEPLLERWDGTAWHVVPSPALPSGALGGGEWNGVVALSATDAWAVGSYDIRDPTDHHPLIAHWDGTSWHIVASPDAYGELNSVAAAGANDVRAVGPFSLSGTATGRRLPLIEQWNGATWQIVPSPELSAANGGELLGITADGAGTYWAVGRSFPAVTEAQTLTLHCP